MSADNIALAIAYGFRSHVWEVPMEYIEQIMRSLFIGEMTYFLSMTLVNSSMLILYWRNFAALKSARVVLRTLACLLVLWACAAVCLGSLKIDRATDCLTYSRYLARWLSVAQSLHFGIDSASNTACVLQIMNAT